MFDLLTCADSASVISSLAAASGASPPVSPDGPTTGRSGPARARASRSASRGKDSGEMIQGICGPTFTGSLPPADQRSALANRLLERLATIGSTERALIWDAKVTPAKHLIFRLAPSTRLTSEIASIGAPHFHPTPLASDVRKHSENPDTVLRRMGKAQQIALNAHVALLAAMNPTPTVADVAGGRKARSGARSVEPLLNGLLASYSPTPRATDGEKGGPNQSFGAGGTPLPAIMHSYSQTPTSLSFKDSHQPGNSRSLNKMREHYAMDRSGPTPNGSSVPSTAKRGAPNPEFAFWLMGFPAEWVSGALAAMRSFRSSRRKSSAR